MNRGNKYSNHDDSKRTHFNGYNRAELTPIDGNDSTPKMVIYVLSTIFALAFLASGFYLTKLLLTANTAPRDQVASFSRPEMPQITDDALEQIDRLISRQYATGQWRYSGTELQSDVVKVYIQLPEKMTMEKSHQQRYIKQAMCPDQNSRFWQLIAPQQLQFNLFTTIKQISISATCA